MIPNIIVLNGPRRKISQKSENESQYPSVVVCIMNSLLVLWFCMAVATARLIYQQDYVYAYKSSNTQNNEDGDDGDDGDDNPIPNTSFSCSKKIDGYYADVEAKCEVFHYCQTFRFPDGKNKSTKWSFACPETTIFNQELLTCTPPNDSFSCDQSSDHYDVNQNLTQSSNTSQSNSSTTSTTSTTTQKSIPNSYFFHIQQY